MQENRKQIIINEILYWKQNRLLPDQYCDFLLALYTEGKGLQTQTGKSKSRKTNALLLLLIPTGIFLFYFTELSLTLQIVMSVFFLVMGIYLIFILAKKGLLFQIPLIITAILLLFISVQLTLTYTSSPFSLYMVIAINCLLWLFIGLKFKQLYFSISGIAGLLLLVISIFQSNGILF